MCIICIHSFSPFNSFNLFFFVDKLLLIATVAISAIQWKFINFKSVFGLQDDKKKAKIYI